MTTVCWDGKELVSDSRACLGDTIHQAPFQKIFTPEENEWWEINGVKAVAVGFAGEGGAIEYIKEKLREGITFKTRMGEDEEVLSHALIIDENGICWCWRVHQFQNKSHKRYELLPMLPPIAIGTGEPFAVAAMAIGKDARAAVKTAAKLDIYTGGDLQIWTFPGKPDVPSVRPPKPEPAVAAPQVPAHDVTVVHQQAAEQPAA